MKGSFNDDNKYISMDEFNRSWYFYDEEIRVSDEDIKNIKPFTYIYSELLWSLYISNHNCHFNFLDHDDKVKILNKEAYNWLEDWNKCKYENLKNYLSINVPYKQSDTIIVFWSKASGVETNWNTFTKYWVNV